MSHSTRSAIYRALRFVVVILLVAFVLHRARLTTPKGWAEWFETLRGSDLGFLAASLVFTPLVHLHSTVKWYALTRATQMRVPLGRLYYFFVVGRFYNLILPSNIGGDLIRIRMLGVASGRYADAAATVFIERLTGFITLVLYASLAIVVATAELRSAWLLYAVVITSGVVFGICWAILDDRPVRAVIAALEGRASLLDRLVAKLVTLRNSIVVFRDMPSALAIAFANSVVFYMLTVVNVWLALRVFEPTVGFAGMLIAVPIMMFVVNIPLSVGNVGIMEFAYTFVLGAFGVSPQAALSAALLMRLKMVLAAAGGGVVYALSEGRSSSADVVRAAIPDQSPHTPIPQKAP